VGISRFIQAIGNGGVALRPTIEEAVARSRASDAGREGTRIMSEATARKVLAAMRLVVQHGTAASAGRLLDDSEWSMAGKTGTPEIPGERDSGWFAGLALDAQGRPRYTVVVYLRGGGPGGAKPATIAAQMVRVLAGHSADVSLPDVAGGGD
jgi:cell division protein FtsI/penicillin-binding protein 2